MGNKSKKRIWLLYTFLVGTLIIFMFLLTFTILNNKYMDGKVNKNTYYDIVLNDITMDFETTTKVKINSDSININIDDLYNYNLGNSINIVLNNVGSSDAVIDNISVVNKSSNVDVDLLLSLKKGDIIYAGGKKNLKIDIKNNQDIINNYSFDIVINYSYLIK